MNLPVKQKRSIILLLLLLPILALFFYVATRSGPLAPVEVTIHTVSSQTLRPALFGIGSVEARYSYQVGPTAAGRIGKLTAQVGDLVTKGAVLGEMDPVDLDERLQAQKAAIKRAEATVADAVSRQQFARTQARRYAELLPLKATTEELAELKQQELATADAALTAAREEQNRLVSEYQGLQAQRNNLLLVAPVSGLVVQRMQEPGTTVVAGQGVIELIDPATIWINTRFDQVTSGGLAQGLPARIELRSQRGRLIPGHVARVEPKGDSITEELLAKVSFEAAGKQLPSIGELAEVTVNLPPLQAELVIPNAALQRDNNRLGVWLVTGKGVKFAPVTTAAADLEGQVQVLSGISKGDQIVWHSSRKLTSNSRVRPVKEIRGSGR